MNDKQTTALVLLLIIAFLFWLYNSSSSTGGNKLSQVVDIITGKTATGVTSASLTGASFNQAPSVFEAQLAPNVTYSVSGSSGQSSDNNSLFNEAAQAASIYAEYSG